jgi:hypothetical protein
MFRGRCLIGAKSGRPSSLSAGGTSRAELFNVRVDLSGRSWRIVLAAHCNFGALHCTLIIFFCLRLETLIFHSSKSSGN